MFRLLMPWVLAPLLLGSCVISSEKTQTVTVTHAEDEGASVTLPAGDVNRGLATFEMLFCTACHTVRGYDFPDAIVTMTPPIELGRATPNPPSDLEIFISIIDPGHEVHEKIKRKFSLKEGQSPMWNYRDVLKVQEALDLVAFIKSAYGRD